MQESDEEVPRDAFGHVRLDEINPGKWFARQLSDALGAEKTLVQKSGYFARSAKPNQRDLNLIKKTAFYGAQKAIDGKSGVAGLDDNLGQNLGLIDFERIKGGKSFDINQDWFKTMVSEIRKI